MSRAEWIRDLEAAERELGEAKTVAKVRGIQQRIKQIKTYIAQLKEVATNPITEEAKV